MSNVTPPGPAGAESVTLKVKVVVPLLPSICDTSLIERFGIGVPPCGVKEKLSTASPSSAPEAFKSFQRIQKVAPLETLRLGIAELTEVRLAAAFPSSAMALAAVFTGLVKSSE